MPAARILPYKPQLSGDKAKDMKAMPKFMPNSDKEYYMTLLNMNDSEFETSDAPDEQRLVDEVPSGPVTRKVVHEQKISFSKLGEEQCEMKNTKI